ncbi:hypothetical protein TrLO_g13594 [Triparma laevis f. longispina]|uniref:Uncharacterized protein n=1 Tax=Triparma laevis f. longispina TaxID=1714387 RepID=A0A9W7EJH1_9STRA|nr:hypothetical protein TrLO_g13594 [Triparma laevis f. longispina]
MESLATILSSPPVNFPPQSSSISENALLYEIFGNFSTPRLPRGFFDNEDVAGEQVRPLLRPVKHKRARVMERLTRAAVTGLRLVVGVRIDVVRLAAAVLLGEKDASRCRGAPEHATTAAVADPTAAPSAATALRKNKERVHSREKINP